MTKFQTSALALNLNAEFKGDRFRDAARFRRTKVCGTAILVALFRRALFCGAKFCRARKLCCAQPCCPKLCRARPCGLEFCGAEFCRAKFCCVKFNGAKFKSAATLRTVFFIAKSAINLNSRFLRKILASSEFISKFLPKFCATICDKEIMSDKILADNALVAAKTARKAERKFNTKRRRLNLKIDADFCGANFKIDAKSRGLNSKAEMKFCKANEADPKIALARRVEPEPLKFPDVNFT